MLPLTESPTAGVGLLLGSLAHTVGWPVVAGGSARLTDAMADAIVAGGGQVETGRWVRSLADLPPAPATLLDVSPRAFLGLAGDRLPSRYRDALARFRYGPGICKVDFALSGPVPWRNEAVRRAGTVHLGGGFEEIAAGEAAVARSEHPESPYVLVVQAGVADPSRAPDGQHALWAYCHVPSGSTVDMTARIEAQIERFAPGFRDLVLGRHTMTAAQEEAMNPNYVGGDIACGAQTVRQVLARPAARVERLPDPAARDVPVLVGDTARARGARPVRRTGRADRAAGHLRRAQSAGPERAGAPPGRRGTAAAMTQDTAPRRFPLASPPPPGYSPARCSPWRSPPCRCPGWRTRA